MSHNLRYPLGKSRVLDTYPELSIYPEFRQAEDTILRFVFTYYDPGCPYMHITDPTERKRVVWEAVGGEEEPDTASMTKIITRFFRLLSDHKFEQWISGEEALADLYKRVREPIDAELEDDKAMRAYTLKKKCYDDADDIRTKQEKLKQEIFGTHATEVAAQVAQTAEDFADSYKS